MGTDPVAMMVMVSCSNDGYDVWRRSYAREVSPLGYQ